ncbi:hypothetical protein MHB81_00695 [Paenibacillus sp. FSL H7-0326]
MGQSWAVPPLIGSPDALILYGGRKELFDAYQPILQVMEGSTTYFSEDTGVELLYDLAMLTMLYGAWYSYFHAHALLRTANASAENFLPYASYWLHALTSKDSARILDEGLYMTELSNMAVNKLRLDIIVKSSRKLDVTADWLLPI